MRKRTTLHRRLLLFFIGMSVILILTFTILLSLFGINGRQHQSVEKQLTTELSLLSESIESDFGRISIGGISMAEELIKKSEDFFDEHTIGSADLKTETQHIEPLLSEYMETMINTANTRYCGGVFVLLDASIKSDSGNEKAGIFLKKTQPTSTIETGVDIYYLRGPANIARDYGLMLIGQWQMEYDITGQEFWNEVMQTAKEHPELPLSRLYCWTGRVILKNNSESGFLLCLPLRDSDGNVFGVCGIEVSDRMFKSLYTPSGGEFEEIFTVMAPISSNGLCTSKGLLAGNNYLSGTRWDKDLFETDRHEGFVHYSNDAFEYAGVEKQIKLYPETSPYQDEGWSVAILMPKDILHEAVTGNQYIFIWVALALLLVSIIISTVITGHYIKPVNEVFEHIRSKGYHETTTLGRIPEIDDLFAYLAKQDREQDELLSHHVQKSESLQGEVQRLNDEKSALQTQVEQVQTDNSRLAYHRKDEVDPDSYEMFIERLHTLSKREKEVFALYVEGKSAKEIAAILEISDNGLKYHNKNIYSKLGVSSRKELLRYVAIMKHEQ